MVINHPLENTTVLAGAGISVDAGLPDAMSLLSYLLDQLTTASAHHSQVELTKSLTGTWIPPQERLRFEVAIGWIVELYDGNADLLSFLDSFDLPDRLHRRLATAAVRGATLCTVNFDDLLEQAIQRISAIPVTIDVNNKISTVVREVPVFKLHGSRKIWSSGTAAAASAQQRPFVTASRIVRSNPRLQLNETAMEWLHSAIDGRRLVVIGYSGSDDLDIVPALRQVVPASCVWVDYDDCTPRDVTADWLHSHGEEKQRLVRVYKDAGASVSVLHGSAHGALDLLGFPSDFGTDAKTPDWRKALDPWLRHALTIEPTGLALTGFLLSELGHTSEAQNCFRAAPAPPGREADIGWTRGRRAYELAQQEHFKRAGDDHAAIKHARQARGWAIKDMDVPLRLRVEHLIARLYYALDEDEKAVSVLDEALANAPVDRTLERAYLLEWRGRVGRSLEGVDAALPYLDDAIRLYERAGNSGGLADALTERADALLRIPRVNDALADSRAAAAAAKLPLPDRLFMAKVAEGACLFALDRLADAQNTLELALADFANREEELTEVFHSYSYLARAAAECGDYQLARSWIGEGTALDTDGRFERQVARLQSDLIGIELLAGRPDAAAQIRRNGTFPTQHSRARAAILGTIAGVDDEEVDWALNASILRTNCPELSYTASTIARTAAARIDLLPFMRAAVEATDRIPNLRWTSMISRWLANFG